MATGSRTAKLALILILLVCLINRSSRTIALYTLPSTLSALAIAFYFQSLPRAITYFASLIQEIFPVSTYFLEKGKVELETLEWMSMRGKFFQDAERHGLIENSLAYFLNSSTPQKFLGNGLGTAGFRTSEIPSPHITFFDLIIETGLIGTIFYSLWLYLLLQRLWMDRTDMKNVCNLPLILITTCFACLMVFSLTYEIITIGLTFVMLAMIFAYPLAFNTLICQRSNHNVSS